ncbi:MAG: STAS domain-containing protein [Phycisphaerae bacterium]|nr:STAS domain-containing protein [Phycisphaerae bacterium]
MVTMQHFGTVTVLTVRGELTSDTVQDFIDQRDQAMAESRCNLVIDCQAVDGFDSMGLEMLNATRRACEQLHGAVKLCSLDTTGRQILAITRLDRKFEVFDDLESAVRSFD